MGQKRALKRVAVLMTLLALILSFLPAMAGQKYTALPAVFKVQVESQDRYEGNKEQYIYKEYLKTSNPRVDADIRRIVDEMDAAYSPLLVPQAQARAKLYNRLDIEVNYFRTGQSALSTLIIARNTHKKQQKDVAVVARVYDLATGDIITLDTLFGEDSPAWDILSQGVKEHLSTTFPKEERDISLVEALCQQDALKEAAFTLSGMELTLHYPLATLFPGKTGLAHVRFFYPQFQGMMTPAGQKHTDNSLWKMVALTFDDGPRGEGTEKTLNALRRNGMRGTFFTVGKLYEDNLSRLHREYDANHLVANHSWNHWNGHGLKPAARLPQVQKVQDFITDTLGETPKYFRAPGGTYPPWIEVGIGLPLIQWSVDTYDFRGRSAQVILANIQKNIREGDIILMHDTGDILNTALDGVAEFLWNNGYMAVTVEELALAQGVDMQPDTVYFRFYQGDYSERRDSNTN